MKLCYVLPRVACALSVFALAPSAAAGDDAATASVREQLDEDVTPIPVGMGSLFVPSLTEAALEPPVVVFYKGERVASGRTGERIVLPPGTYEVTAGDGDPDGHARTTIQVIAGVTTPVKPFFGAVRVQIVDDAAQPLKDTFIIVSADSKQSYGPYETSAEVGAARARTLLLPPGNYVIALGGKADTGEDSVAFSVVEGKLLRYRLVTDGDRLLRSEFADKEAIAERKLLRLRWVLGGTGTFTNSENQLSGYNGDSATVDAFSRLEAGIDNGRHLALFSLNINQAFIGLESQYGTDLPIFAVQNDTEAELLYTYRVAGIVGPYARGIARSSLFEDHYLPDRDVNIVTRNESGAVVKRGTASHGDRVRKFEAFAPLSVQEGAGLTISPIDNELVTVVARGGAALRQGFYNEGRYIESRSGDTINMIQLEDTSRFGGELTGIASLRLGRALSVESRFDSFIPRQQIFDGEELRPVFRWDNTLALRLTRAASVVYGFSLRRDELALKELQRTQGLSLRIQHVVF